MGQNLDETKPIKELVDKLDEWANRREPKLPEHVGYISFYGSLKKAVGDLPNLVEDLLRSYAPEQLNSFQKVLDDLYEKAKAVSHERSKSGEEANILKCQAQAASARLAKKLRLVEGIIESRREQIENSKKPAETEQNRKTTIVAIIISFIVDLVFELLVYFVPFTWVKNHPNSYGLQGSIIFLIPCLIVGLFKPQYRKGCWGVGAIAFIVLLLSLIGGPADSNVN